MTDGKELTGVGYNVTGLGINFIYMVIWFKLISLQVCDIEDFEIFPIKQVAQDFYLSR